jgi:hypothetical protein
MIKSNKFLSIHCFQYDNKTTRTCTLHICKQPQRIKKIVDENKIDLSKVYYKGRAMERSQGRKLNFL